MLDSKNLPNLMELKDMDVGDVQKLADDIRQFLIQQIGKTGGHIGANLGTIELTLALHSVFYSPEEPLLFDTGHIGYTHKILTGRLPMFDSLNTFGGMNRFITPSESEHDIIEASHAGTALSVGLGMALKRKIDSDEHSVVAVVGDSAMAEGSSFEALNHAVVEDTNLVLVVNDNGFAISPGYGGLNDALSSSGNHAAQFFESIGADYIGPVDGHDVESLVAAFRDAKSRKKMPVVHVKTIKGKGWEPADDHPFRMHFSFPYDPETGAPLSDVAPPETYADVVGKVMTRMMRVDEDIVCVTPSTIYATGLAGVFEEFPERCFDPGMEEQHALTMTVGMALQGSKPVIAYQSTFLQRAFDQLLHDVCFSNLPITILTTRSGFSGYDNPTHHGIYDISFMQPLPNLRIYYPKDKNELEAMIERSINEQDSPVVIMMPYGPVDDFSPVTSDVFLPEEVLEGSDVLLVTVGNKYEAAKKAAENLGSGLVNLRCLQPLDKDLLMPIIDKYDRIVCIEEAIIDGGMSSAFASLLADCSVSKPLLRLGIPRSFVQAGSNEELTKLYGLDAEGIEKTIRANFQLTI